MLLRRSTSLPQLRNDCLFVSTFSCLLLMQLLQRLLSLVLLQLLSP